MKKFLCSAPAVVLVAACGGGSSGGDGSGGSDPTRNFVSFAEIGPNDTVTMAGNTKTVSFTPSADGDVDTGPVQSSNSATATVRYRNDLLSRLAIRGSGADLTIDEDNGGEFSQVAGAVAGQTADGNSVISLLDPTAVGFNYQTFGLWTNGETSGTAGVGSFGARTGAANMPSETTASYSGASTGLVDGDGEDFVTGSTVDVSTDFSNVTVVSSNTEFYDIETGAYLGTAGELDFTALGTLSEDGFTAIIEELAGNGRVDGQFYGPGAEEVGGTFEASGGGGTYIGAFGAN